MKKLLGIVILGLLLYNNTILAFENSGPFFSQISHAYKISENQNIDIDNNKNNVSKRNNENILRFAMIVIYSRTFDVKKSKILYLTRCI